MKAGQLCIGHLLVPRAGPTAFAVTVIGIERAAGPTIVYNLTNAWNWLKNTIGIGGGHSASKPTQGPAGFIDRLTHGPYGGGAYGIANNLFDASTYNLGYISWLSGSDRIFDYIGTGLNISTQVALAYVTDGGSAEVEEASVGQIALGKFNVYTANGYEASLEPFAQNLSSLLGTPVTSFNDWSMRGFSSDSDMILHMMGSANTIHFNMQGVNAAQGLSGAGAVPTAERELQQVFQRGWAGKTIFYF